MDKPGWTRNQRTACRRSDAMHRRLESPARAAGRLERRVWRTKSGDGMSTATAASESALNDGSQAAARWNDSGAYSSSPRQQSLTAVAGTPPPDTALVLPPSRSRHPRRPRSNEEVGRAAAVLSSLSTRPLGKTYRDPEDGITFHHCSRNQDKDGHDIDVDADATAVAEAAATTDTDSDTGSSLQHGDAADGAKSHLVEMLAQEDMEDRVMQRGVRIVYVGQEYSNIHYLIRQRARRASSASVHHFPSNQIARKYTSHELDRIPREAFALPPKAVVDALLAAYFRHVHPGFPVLDKAAFLGQYRRRDPRNPLSLLVLQAVLMVGAHVYREEDCAGQGQGLVDDRASLKAAFFRRAKMLFDARFEWNRDVVVQAALLMMWHSEGVEDIGANSYYWVGVAARTALGLGMHRDTRASTLIAHDKRLWRRLWWILVQLDGIVTLSYGRPPATRLDESDVPELVLEELVDGAEDEDEDGDGDGDDSSDRREDQGIDAEYLIHQMHLSCIVARTLRDRFGLQVSPERRRHALVEADQRLAAWMARLPPSLRCRPDGRAVADTGSSASVSISPWTTMLHLTYNNLLILLHRPPPNPASADPSTSHPGHAASQENMGICSAAAGTIVSLLEAAAARDELRFLNVFAVDALLTTLIQLSAEIRMANPILAGHALQRFEAAMAILRQLAGIWLHAEIVLRLFEDRSSKVRAEMLLGKETTGNIANAGAAAAQLQQQQGHRYLDVPPAYLPHALHPPPITPGSTSLPMDSYQSLLLSSTGISQPGQHQQQNEQFVPLNEQLDWTSLYWENGLASLSPFSDMPMYLSM
ncbi:hypothetical protein SCUCBS95973_007140 [Sporothrix curviconia]|uniref:Xylanolytic transcriptional activator regulatory domain-containing protein n=1 Tax=Sporothrix curviconia TaxID=1260050 RepID=A0ABP0CAX6_9PEZI